MSTIFDVPGTNPVNPFSVLIQDLAASKKNSTDSALEQTATQIVTAIATSSHPAHSFWELWDVFFIAVVNPETSHALLLGLLDNLRIQSPSQPTNVPSGSAGEKALYRCVKSDGKIHWSELPLFDAQWRDAHDVLWAWRDWHGVRTSDGGQQSTASTQGSSNPSEFYVRFCEFSATRLKALNKGNGDVRSIRVFYACQDVLERNTPPSPQSRANRISPERVRDLDVRVTALWLRDGGRTLWDTNYEELRHEWASALDDKTELWPREDGLTRERWQLWYDRLQALSVESSLTAETKAVATEAAQVVQSLLRHDVNSDN